MRSIQTKLVALIMAGIVLSSLLIGGLGLWFAIKTLENDSTTIIELTSNKDAAIIDKILDSAMQGTETLAEYAIDSADSITTIVDKEQREIYTEELEKVVTNIANNVVDVKSVYIRYAPEIAPVSEGLFYTKDEHGQVLHETELTDITKYDPSDMEHVGWYYIPKANGKPTWMEPYYNKNIDVNMISYVIPLYKDGHFIGVAGMDIDFDCIKREISEISVYNTGYAFLVNNRGQVMYHRDAAFGATSSDADTAEKIRMIVSGENEGKPLEYVRNGKEKKMFGTTLTNGMTLIITAPSEEINAEISMLVMNKVAAMVAVLGLFLFLIIWCARNFVKPIKELNAAALRVVEGDLNIDVKVKTRDEVGELADSLRRSMVQMKEYIDYINGLAYKDTLTDVNSSAAYLHDIKTLDEEIKNGVPEFAVVVLDINGLKQTNDSYGHDCGDKLIIRAADLIREIFPEECIYRMGGDEFVVILRGDMSRKYIELLGEFEEILRKKNAVAADEMDKISIACGGAEYNGDIDRYYSEVFKRADDAMYNNKAAMKAAI